jgi:hypothetical protein
MPNSTPRTKEVGMMLVAVWCAFGIATNTKADDGVWSTDDSTFAQANVFCTRTYVCVPAQDVVYGADKKIASTPPQLVRGVCSADGGPADSCNTCLTIPPTDKCEWHLE